MIKIENKETKQMVCIPTQTTTEFGTKAKVKGNGLV